MDAHLPSATVAVITRTRNRPILLCRARISVARQTFRDLVWVVVNDGGDLAAVDEEVAVARTVGVQAVAVHLKERRGIEAASNAGIAVCSSRYIVIHDDDDSWEPEFLSATVRVLEENRDLVGVITHSNTIIEQFFGSGIIRIARRPRNRWLRTIYLADLARGNLFPPISFLFRRRICDAVGGYDERFPVLGDWEFNLKMSMKGDIRVIPELFANYHVRSRVDASSWIYANSMVAQRDLHDQQDALIRNELLRKDLADQRFGLGCMLALGRLQRQPRRRMDLQLPWYLNALDWAVAMAAKIFSRPHAKLPGKL
jgi:glycosyltransferase involved in cell wall biosynthesis